jgi:hypothetical protein
MNVALSSFQFKGRDRDRPDAREGSMTATDKRGRPLTEIELCVRVQRALRREWPGSFRRVQHGIARQLFYLRRAQRRAG